MKFQGVWRTPGEETVGLYPGLVVHDGRQTGSITVGRSRLPVWAMVGESDWADAIDEYGAEDYGFTEQQLKDFIWNLLDVRGEFARLLLVLADCERADRFTRFAGSPWWERKTRVSKVQAQLRRCISALDSGGAGIG